MPLTIFGRFHAREGQEAEVEAAIREVVPQTRAEADCIAVSAHRSIRDPRLFYIHSSWPDEAAFERHASLPHTVRFVARVENSIDHEVAVTRAEPFA